MPSTLLDDILKALSPNQVEGLKLKRCVDCGFFKEGYCTQSSPATKPLTPYDAQLCPYYSPPAVIASIKEEAQPVGYTKIDRVNLIDLITLITTINEITTIKKIEQINIPITSRRELIANSDFINEFACWSHYLVNWVDGATEVCGAYNVGWIGHIMKFLGAGSYLSQELSVPIDHTVWGVTLKIWVYGSAVTSPALKVRFDYSDGSMEYINVNIETAYTWLLKTIYPTANKKIWSIGFHWWATPPPLTFYIGQILTVI